MNAFFAALKDEFSLRLREEAREKAGQIVQWVATIAVVGTILLIFASIGILLR